jgi:lipopolysaccharide exporter
VRLIPPRLNLKGELFSSTFTYGATALIKLGSSLILTRLLAPQAYGIFGILLSIVFIVNLVSDVGTTAFLIRHPRGGEAKFIHAVWTIRFLRCLLNFSVVFLCAPIIAAIYSTPVLTNALRVFSFQFLIAGFESMSFILSQRDQKARIGNYADLISSAAMTVFVIVAASILRSYLALIYGVLLQQALLTIGSHFFYRNIGIRFAYDREVAAEQFKFAGFVLPSSLLTMVLSQYDKLILLKLFNLTLVGVYSVAGNMLGPISGVIVHNARVVLYARCSAYFRSDKESARVRYYADNQRLLMVAVILPATVAGFAQLFVSTLYDRRYAMAGSILTVMGLGAVISAFQASSENLLVASGRTHMVLLGNVVRIFTVIPASILGYYLFGFYGFLWFGQAATVILVIYFFRQQRRYDLLDLSKELRLLGLAALVFVGCFSLSHLLLAFIPADSLHLLLRKH